MAVKLTKKLAKKFQNEIRFIKGLVDQPKSVGAIFPTSSFMAKRMASIVNLHSGLPVLELGPGTGVITKAIVEYGVAPEDLHAVEFSESFLPYLRADYPRVNFIQGDAFDVDAIREKSGIERFDCVISALPLLNFPSSKRVKLIEDLLEIIPDGRPVIQFSYGPLSPVVAGAGNYNVEHFGWVARNLPPAQLWVYRKR
ncbi:MAG: methyltransferase domain-containing protein [Rhizobiaceae bacterium]|nr:methyltransferase domain-containing protein [Rhizobiaceae bacterium]